jgi:hypothetical protein
MKTLEIQETILQDLQNRYQKAVLNKKELAYELGVSVSAINNYICQGVAIPEYCKIGDAKNARVVFPIINIASYLSNTVRVA